MENKDDFIPSKFPSKPPTRHMSTPSEQKNRQQHDLPQRIDSSPNLFPSYERHDNYYEAPKTYHDDLPVKMTGTLKIFISLLNYKNLKTMGKKSR